LNVFFAVIAVRSDSRLRNLSQLQTSHSDARTVTDMTNPFPEGHRLSVASQLISAQNVVEVLSAKQRRIKLNGEQYAHIL
jgi:hypothetical protein